MKTIDRLKLRESHFAVQIASENWFATADRKAMSGMDGALHLIGKPTLSETELQKLRDRLHVAGVPHNMPKLDPRIAKPGNSEYTEEQLKGLPSEAGFVAMLGEIKEALWTKKDALIAENRIATRQARGFAKARKAIHNLLRDHRAGARRALEAMRPLPGGGTTPSWILGPSRSPRSRAGNRQQARSYAQRVWSGPPIKFFKRFEKFNRRNNSVKMKRIKGKTIKNRFAGLLQ